MIRTSLSALLIAVLLIGGTAQAELSKQLKIGEQTMQLNGAGTRTKTFVQIYESGLYLMKPSRDARWIISTDELMAIRIKITSGFVSRASLVSSLQDSLKQSTGGNVAAIAKETQMFMDALKDDVKKNDIYDFVNVPKKGLYIVKNGKIKGNIPGKAFKQALFGIWLSNSPVDKNLRQAMLTGGNIR